MAQSFSPENTPDVETPAELNATSPAFSITALARKPGPNPDSFLDNLDTATQGIAEVANGAD